MVVINIAQEYSKTPGGRFIKEGCYSGEDFREKMLIPKYELAYNQNEHLRVILDGGYGYGSSFLEEAFGGLVRKNKDIDISIIEIISDEEPQLVLDVKKYMTDAKAKTRGK